MAIMSIELKKQGVCEECGQKKKGVAFAPVIDIPGGFTISRILEEKFLCQEHFEDFIMKNRHEVRHPK